MASYGLRYFKELPQSDGKTVRLELWEKNGENSEIEIGPVVQDLRLDIQGDSDIDAPIVKTSLTMTFVDAPDHEDADTKKCGDWGIFYTSDATKWKVLLKYKNSGTTAFSDMWGGYLTPDSYNETLVYRGSVTLIARDNIGHMQDFPFDAEGDSDGMISLQELIETAWSKIESPMVLNWHGNARWLYTEGQSARATYMNVAAFKDGDWFEAVEAALYGYGLVMRYTGSNEVSIYALRNIPLVGTDSDALVTRQEPVFIAGAERELSPAARRIEERVSYELVDTLIQPQVKDDDYSGEVDDYTIYPSGSAQTYKLYAWHILNNEGSGWRDSDAPIYFNPLAYEKDSTVDDRELDFMWLASSDYIGSDSMYSPFYKSMIASNIGIEFKMGQVYYLNSDVLTRFGKGMYPTTLSVSISVTQSGVTQYLNADGEWQTSLTKINLSVDDSGVALLSIPAGEFSGIIALEVRVYRFVSGRSVDAYAPLYSLAFTEQNPLLETNNVNTNYNESNNVVLSREPKIGPAMDNSFLAGVIKNGIFYKSGGMYLPAKAWYWAGNTPQQMAVYNHLQLLCYHAKPNNILRGTIVNADITDLAVLWSWSGVEHMLVSGSLNFISGHIDNAVLREFSRYENMWGMLEPADMPEVEGNSSTNVEGSSSGTSGATVENTTTVNIGGGGGTIELDTYMSDTSENGVMNRVIKAYVDDIEGDITEAYEGAISALDTKIQNALSGKTDKATTEALAQRVTAEEAVTAEYEEWWSALKAKVVVENGNVKISTNLIVTGDTSSGGEGSDTPASGTVTGIKVSELQTLTPNSAGIIDMVSTLASIDVSEQLEDYLPLAGGILTGKVTALSRISMRGTILEMTKDDGTGGIMLWNGESSGDGVRNLLIYDGTAWRKALHSSNYSDYALPLSGGKMTGTITIGTWTAFGVSGSNFYLGSPDYPLLLRSNGTTTINNNPLIHSGNIGSYASGYLKSRNISGVERLPSYFDDNCVTAWFNNTGVPLQGTWTSGIHVKGFSEGYASWELAAYSSNGDTSNAAYHKLYWRLGKGDSWQDWKTIAFTDSNVASAQALTHSNGTVGATVDASGNIVLSQHIYYGNANTALKGNAEQLWAVIGGYAGMVLRNESVEFRTSQTTRFVINSSGNVTIGGNDLASTINGCKLYVDGTGYFAADTYLANWAYLRSYKTDGSIVTLIGLNNKDQMVINAADSGVNTAILGGNVLIGTTTDNGAKLQLAGHIAPTTSGSYALGTNTYQWDAVYSMYHLAKSGSKLILGANNSSHITIETSGAVTMSSTLDVTSHITTSNRVYAPYIFIGKNAEGIYLGNEGIYWHTNSNAWASTLLTFASKEITAHVPVTMSSTLSVGGNTTINGNTLATNYALYDGASNPRLHLTDGSKHHYVQLYQTKMGVGPGSGLGLYILTSGYTGINTNDPKHTLDVNGTGRFTGAVTMSSTLAVTGNITCSANIIASGDTSSGSDIRFKDRIEDMAISISDIANAPLFTFKWNDREDDTIHLGSSAQYWERITPQLVSGQDFKSLNYATLGVAMGISLAKKSINHEARIKELEKEIKRLKEERL